MILGTEDKKQNIIRKDAPTTFMALGHAKGVKSCEPGSMD